MTELSKHIESIPVIDCHEHQAPNSDYPDPRYPGKNYGFPDEPIAFVLRGYFPDDLVSAGATDEDMSLLKDTSISTKEKWPIFSRLWKKTGHTTYALEVQQILSRTWGSNEVSLEAFEKLRGKISKVEDIDGFFAALNIKAVLVDPWWWGHSDITQYLAGKMKLPDCYRMIIPLPFFHFHPGEPSNLHVKNSLWVQQTGEIVAQPVSSLEDFLSAVFQVMKKMKERGAVGIKNQMAYTRTLRYDLVTEDDAERLFNKILDDPNSSLGWPEAKPLDDFLFHTYLRYAEKLSLPVQIHTGYLAGKGNRVDRANASHLANAIELHKNVTFDLFHGNWPYMGDLLFLAKNYANVFMNLCWVHAMDPYYTVELLTRAIYAVPHAKILGFGADYHYPEHVETHLSLARNNISEALSRLVDRAWLNQKEALAIAEDWLYNTPNKIFNLGLEEI